MDAHAQGRPVASNNSVAKAKGPPKLPMPPRIDDGSPTKVQAWQETPFEQHGRARGRLAGLTESEVVPIDNSGERAFSKPEQPDTSRSASKDMPRAGSKDAEKLAGSKELRKSVKTRRSMSRESPASLFGFADPEQIKMNVRMTVAGKRKAYNVQDLYHESGFFQALAKSPAFDNLTLSVIALNAIFMAIDTDWNKQRPLESMDTNDLLSSPLFFFITENTFCFYFTLELVIRFGAFAQKSHTMRDGWFVFDSLLVIMMIIETWVMPLIQTVGGAGGSMGNVAILRLLRLLRLSRLLRMLRSLPELMILIKGMATAMKSVSYVMCLLVIFTYVFGIAFTQLAAGSAAGDVYFSNVALSMYSLLIHAAFMDDMASFMNDLRLEEGQWPLMALAFVFVALASLTLMNMLIGVLCEVVSAVAATEKEEILANQVMEKMMKVVDTIDENGDRRISYAEFSKMIEKPEVIRCLQDVGVNPMALIDFADLMFFEDQELLELSFEEFMEKVIDMRGSNTATVKDTLHLWMSIKKHTHPLLHIIGERVEVLDAKIDNVVQNVGRKMDEKMEKFSNLMDQKLERMEKLLATAEVEQPKKVPQISQMPVAKGDVPRYVMADGGGPVYPVPGTVKRIGDGSGRRSMSRTFNAG
mmetsp:Transcript_954/g.1919  ORF Transcript_954/g.1919 Transcript_954/m.1919 type:complete len:642 (+) Transcript_954:54-1979(+)